MRAVREIPSISETSSSEIHGQLTLGIISNFTDRTFDQAIATFHERFPQVEILISTLSWSSISGAILRSEIDIGGCDDDRARGGIGANFDTHGAHPGEIVVQCAGGILRRGEGQAGREVLFPRVTPCAATH